MALTFHGFKGRTVRFDDVQEECLRVLEDNASAAACEGAKRAYDLLLRDFRNLVVRHSLLKARADLAEEEIRDLQEQLNEQQKIIDSSIADLDPDRV